MHQMSLHMPTLLLYDVLLKFIISTHVQYQYSCTELVDQFQWYTHKQIKNKHSWTIGSPNCSILAILRGKIKISDHVNDLVKLLVAL